MVGKSKHAAPGDASVAAGHETAPGDWHALLLRMAGTLPDDLVTEARTWLAEGQPVDVAQALVFAAVAGRVPVIAADAALISAGLTAAGQDPGAVAELELVAEEELRSAPWIFAPVRIDDAEAAGFAPPLLDLSTDPVAQAALDPIDRAGIAAATAEPAVYALWRAWRMPADGSPWPRPRRVFIATVPPERPADQLPALTARLQEALFAAGETDPQVEVCRDDLAMPGYQSAACAHAALLWTGEPPVPIRLARVFDVIHPVDGPGFAPDHPTVDDLDELGRLLDYLDGALPVLTTTATMEDVVDPDHPVIVPLTFRTDGEWIWTDTVSYYLERYAFAPDPELLAHLRAAPAFPPAVSEVRLHRVLSFLQRPEEAEPAWFVTAPGESGSRPAAV